MPVSQRVGRIFKIALAGVLSWPFSVAVHAQDASLPNTIKEWFAEDRANCESEHKKYTLGADAIRKLDLSGDGLTDYVIYDEHTTCGGLPTGCGSGGCGLTIFMQTPKGLMRVFNDVGGPLKISKNGKGYLLQLSRKPEGGGDINLVFSDYCAIDLTNHMTRMCEETPL
jgi:hypothetical protein